MPTPDFRQTLRRLGRSAGHCLDVGLVAGLVTLSVLVVLDQHTGVPLASCYTAAVVVSALLTSSHKTAVVAALTVIVAGMSGLWHDSVGTRDWAVRMALCMIMTTFAVIAAEATHRRKARLLHMTVIAETAQRALLRATPEAIGSVGLATRYVSATAEAAVGGDLYDTIATPFGVRAIVGDVRGKGLAAVQTAASVLGVFRQRALTEPCLGDLTAAIDRVVTDVVGDEDFVTAVLVEVVEDRVLVANCGHHPPLLVTPGRVRDLDTGDPTVPLGLGAVPEITTHPFPAGNRLLLYTDGLIESRDADRNFFRLHPHAHLLSTTDLGDGLDQLLDRVRAHCGGDLGDDLALMLLENRDDTPPRQPPAHRSA